MLTQVAKEKEIGEQPPYFTLFEYQVCIEVDVEGCDHLHKTTCGPHARQHNWLFTLACCVPSQVSTPQLATACAAAACNKILQLHRVSD
jgi:hypothetical protein